MIRNPTGVAVSATPAIIAAANAPDRADPDGLKVGGHQASSASMVTIMTALWFAELTRDDRTVTYVSFRLTLGGSPG